MPSPHHIGPVTIERFARAAQRIRQLYHARNLVIPPGSCLDDLLHECEKYASGIADVALPVTGSQQDELAIAMGAKHLAVFRLAESLDELDRRNAPQLSERLQDIANKQLSIPVQVEQFWAAEYETFCASDFSKNGFRVSFISNQQTSTATQSRVEFLITHKWPVECKKPQSPDSILKNLRAAVQKIDERATARGHDGIVCISLDDARLVPPGDFAEVENTKQLGTIASAALKQLFDEQGDGILDALQGSHARVAIFHLSCPTYEHSTGLVGLPTFRIGYTADGTWLQNNAIVECMAVFNTK